jgi:chondroitin AC lyase
MIDDLMLTVFTLLLAMAAPAAIAAKPGDLATVRDRLVRSILPTDPSATKQMLDQARRAANTLSPDGTWDDIDYADQTRSGWLTEKHLERVLLMARASRIGRDAGSADKDLRNAIDAALDHWLAKDYRNPNWWHNEIGVPQLLAQTCLLLSPELTKQQLDQSLAIIRRSKWTKWTGQNLVWGTTIQVMRGLLEESEATVSEAYQRTYDEVTVTTKEGIQPDFSFHQHGAQLYSGGYGLNFAQDLPRYVSFAWGTRWQIPDDKMRIVTSYLLDGTRWMMHRNRMDYATVGREITRKGKTAVPTSWTSGPISPVGAAYGLLNAVRMLSEQPIPRQDEMKSFAASLQGEGEPLTGSRAFWRSDYYVHHRPGWMASVRMFSDRLLNSEIVNEEGRKSHHLADGMNLLYLTGNEYFDIFPVWDWTKVPGTTAEQDTLEIEPHPVGTKGKTSFVGAASDTACGLACMDLKRGGLRARKSWFFFDQGYVALGADITCTTDRAVATSVNQCLLDTTVEQGDSWIHHGNVGYIFANRATVKLATGKQEGRWSDIGVGADELLRKDVFNLWLDHGSKPAGASYDYTVLPASDVEHTKTYADHPTMRTLANTPKVQAVMDEPTGTVGATFWQAGEVKAGDRTIAVDHPCLVLIRNDHLTVASPSHESFELTVRINAKEVKVTLPTGDRAGASVTVPMPN